MFGIGMKPRKEFKYNVEHFLKLIGDRPCIWDKTAEAYKDTQERKQAWREVCGTLNPDYDDNLTAENQREFEELVQNKWTNIRDSYIRSVKTRLKHGSTTKRYVYHDALTFLRKFIPGVDMDDEEPSTFELKVERKRRKKERRSEEIYFHDDSNISLPEADALSPSSPHKEFVSLRYDDADNSRVMNEDEAFFASLLPTVVQYNLEERLEFRMQVLGVMKKINGKRKHVDDDDDD